MPSRPCGKPSTMLLLGRNHLFVCAVSRSTQALPGADVNGHGARDIGGVGGY
jgi:hypothetical protein